MDYNYKISVITACYNSETYIEQTIQSVIRQTYKNIEYIIIDGGSTDNTLSIIQKYKGKIDIILSEPDDGVYDAFNKGIDAATGDIIYFLNSDDYLFDENTIKLVIQEFINDNKLCFLHSKVKYIDEVTDTFYHKGKNFSLEDFREGNNIPHQGIFVKSELFKIIGNFSLEYKIISDFDFNIKCFKKLSSNKIKFFNKTTAVFRLGGLSNNILTKKESLTETELLIQEHFGVKLELSREKSFYPLIDCYKNWLGKLLILNEPISKSLKQDGISKVAIFGTLKTAVYLYEDLKKSDIKIEYFIDNNIDKAGEFLKEIPIYPLNDIKARDSKIDAVIVTIENDKDDLLIKDIKKTFLNKVNVISWKEMLSVT